MANGLYVLNGETINEAQLVKQAEDWGVSLEELLKANPDLKIKGSDLPEFEPELSTGGILPATQYSSPSDVITSDKYDDGSYEFFDKSDKEAVGDLR